MIARSILLFGKKLSNDVSTLRDMLGVTPWVPIVTFFFISYSITNRLPSNRSNIRIIKTLQHRDLLHTIDMIDFPKKCPARGVSSMRGVQHVRYVFSFKK